MPIYDRSNNIDLQIGYNSRHLHVGIDVTTKLGLEIRPGVREI